MRRTSYVFAIFLFVQFAATAQLKRISIPLGDAVSRALEASLLTGENARPFHIRISVSEPENPQSPYQGAIEEWWVSSNQWRREVTGKDGMRQTIVVANGNRTEKDEGDYFPRWLQSFVNAAFEPVPANSASAFAASGATIDQITLPNGDKSDACARLKSRIGSEGRAIDLFSNVCFDKDRRLKFYGSPGYSMEFHDYRAFGKKQFPREFACDPESGTHLVGKVVALEEESGADSPSLFTPLASTDTRFRSITVSAAQLERFTAAIPPLAWPTIRSGNTIGNLAIYVGVDSAGKVREAWPLNGDNGDMHDFLREQARTWQLKPAVDSSGNPIQIEGAVSFHYETRIGRPLPLVTGAAIQNQILNCPYNPILPSGLLPKATKIAIHLSIDQTGKVAGVNFPGINAWTAFQHTGLSAKECRFKPYLEDGKPTYYFMDLDFTAP